MSNWTKICEVNAIAPGTGVCALVDNQQVAVFRPRSDENVFAISNMDPYGKANVLSRGLIAEHKDALWVASPLKKQRFNLATGACMEDENYNVKAYSTRVVDGLIEVSA
ncbi:nitrite reductase small subunit NirD [Vibrio sp. RC27]